MLPCQQGDVRGDDDCHQTVATGGIMRRRTRLALSAACGTLAVLLAAAHADAAQHEAEVARSEALERYGGEVTSLVVARDTLFAGDVVGQSDVEVREWLVDLAPTDALDGIDDAVGLRLTSAVAAGAPLSTVDFAGNDETLEVPDGRVAVSVRLTDETGVSATLPSGSRLLAYEVGKSGTALIAGDVMLVAASLGTQVAPGSTLTLAVDPRDVTQVLAAAADETLRLVVPASNVEAAALSADAALGSQTVPFAPTTVEAEGGEA